jgi:hypothetical protein
MPGSGYGFGCQSLAGAEPGERNTDGRHGCPQLLGRGAGLLGNGVIEKATTHGITSIEKGNEFMATEVQDGLVAVGTRGGDR